LMRRHIQGAWKSISEMIDKEELGQASA